MHTTQPAKNRSHEYAIQMDNVDKLKHIRQEFIIPSKNDLKSKTLSQLAAHSKDCEEPCIYFCGNSLGLQPRRTSERVSSHLDAWAKKGVLGHFTEHEDSTLPPFLHIDDTAARLMAPLVGAKAEEVAVMETLTANLHFLMASFYQPTKERYKIIIEGKAFPSDHYAVESQIRHHGFDPKEALVIIEPQTVDSAILSTAHILSVIEEHATSTALILLPGIQYYTGQYLDIRQITDEAHALGILIGWDLAHAVGNVTLELARWDVDFAAWCNYKYVNSGPGAIAGLFVNSRHGKVDSRAGFRPRLSGWWGGDKSIRFQMGKGNSPQFLRWPLAAGVWSSRLIYVNLAPDFVPIQGAAGFQVGNPSALALTAVIASLEIFSLTSMTTIRAKSVALTSYLEELLLHPPLPHVLDEEERPYKLITPQDPAKRGAQLSVLLRPGLLDGVMKTLEDAGVIVDERKPDVIRVAPAPLYNTFEEVWHFANIFTVACLRAQAGLVNNGHETEGLKGKADKGWAQIK